MRLTTAPAPPTSDSTSAPEIDLGWLVVGRLDEADREAVHGARERVQRRLAEQFPEFQWRVPLVEQVGVELPLREQPSALLETGAEEREVRRWDFVLVITGADLVGQLHRSARATPSQALAVAVISTARLDPQSTGDDLPTSERVAKLTHRLEMLALHCLGHLAGLPRSASPTSVMTVIHKVSQLDQPLTFDASAHGALLTYYRGVADARVEEEGVLHAHPLFYATAIARNLGGILGSIRKARPWLLPLRLSKLTTAALSALLLLINTAETWEVASSHGTPFAIAAALLTLLGMTSYTVRQQHLLFSRTGAPLTEQVAVARTVVIASIGLGLLTTYMLMFALTFSIGAALYPAQVIQNWGGHADAIVASLRLAGFVAPLGLLIGGLGASFEEQHYVRHLAYVDTEI